VPVALLALPKAWSTRSSARGTGGRSERSIPPGHRAPLP
jgi:hypothetical protein